MRVASVTINHLLGPLFTDLYELTMAAGYFKRRLMAPAAFSLFIRHYPPAMKVARSAYLVGFAGASYVLAG